MRPELLASGDGYCADRCGPGLPQYQSALVQGRAGGHHIVQQQQVFSTHLGILAHGERFPQVLHSFHAVKPRLSIGVPTALKTAHHGQLGSFCECFGKSLSLIESAFPQSCRMKRHRYQAVDRIRLDSGVLHPFDQGLGEHPPQIKLASVLKPMNQIPQNASRQPSGYHAIKSRSAIFAVWAGEFSRYQTIERSGTAPAKRCPDTRRGRQAIPAEKDAQFLGMSTPDAIGGVKQLSQCFKQSPSRVPHVNKLAKLKTKVRAESEWNQIRR